MNTPGMPQAEVLATAEAERAGDGPKHDWMLWASVLASTIALVAAGGSSGLRRLYTPGSSFGYWLGVTGGLMMLALLLYPLRKHLFVMRNMGATRYWFLVHMFLGVAGPILILFHCTFQAHSLNALIALLSMLVVALSGAIGRFGYTKIHYGLGGREKSLDELKALARTTSNDLQSRFHFVPEVERRLREYEAYAVEAPRNLPSAVWRFLTIGWRGKVHYLVCARELDGILARFAAARGWDAAKLRRRKRGLKGLARAYLVATQNVAQFKIYKHLFALWHYLHIPLFFMLLVSGIAHVVAVHMY